jgi:hypothetical protein
MNSCRYFVFIESTAMFTAPQISQRFHTQYTHTHKTNTRNTHTTHTQNTQNTINDRMVKSVSTHEMYMV